MTERIVRGRILTFRDDPRLAGARAWRLIDDGAVAIRDGLIAAVGEARDILAARRRTRRSTTIPASWCCPA